MAGSIYLGILFAAFFVLSGMFFSEEIARIFGAEDGAILDMANTYLKVMLLFAPAFLLNDILLCYVRNDGNPRLSMIATATGSFSNILLDYLFIFPCRMGIFGAVLATGIAPVIGILLMAPHWMKRQKGFHLIRAKLQGGAVTTHLALGLPSLLAQLSSGIVMIVFNLIILRLEGSVGVAAYGVIANISLVVTAVYTGIAQGMQPLASMSYGEGDPAAVRRYLYYAMISMLFFSGAVYLFLFAFAQPIAGIFNSTSSAKLQEIAVIGLKLYFTSSAFTGFNTVLSMYFTSVEQALPAQVLSLLRGLILIIPMAFLLSSLWGMTGVWLSVPATELVVSLYGAGAYWRCKRAASGRG